MTIKLISRIQAVKLAGYRLPFGMHWYLVIGADWYPTYGDWSYTWAGETGLSAVIGKRKAVKESEVAA